MKKRSKVGRPRKTNPPIINGLNPQNPAAIPKKRGRGRPRKYPTKEESETQNKPSWKLVIRGPIPGPADWTKGPGMAWAWGNAPKGKRVHKSRARDRRRGGETREESDCPSVGESDCPSVGESEQSSSVAAGNSKSESDSQPDADFSWLSGIQIPGPIPDLDALINDRTIFRAPDFFSDVPIPDGWNWY